MLSLVYVSSATRLFSDDDLKDLLRQSRDNNSRLDLTGMLLDKGGNFMQLLEGPDDALTALFAKIALDPRHRGVLELLRRPIEQREFSSWSMGFKSLDDPSLRHLPATVHSSTSRSLPPHIRPIQRAPKACWHHLGRACS